MDVGTIQTIAVLVVVGGCLTGCVERPPESEYVTRVGNAYLSEEDVVSALASMPPGLDSTHAAEQVIERWVTDELLVQEARQRQLEDDPEVQRRLAENERSLLISSLIDRLYEEVEPPTEREVASYFDRNVDNLALREPFLLIRYIATFDSASAVAAVALFDTVQSTANPDSVWLELIATSGEIQETSAMLSTSYYPASRLFRNLPHMQDAISSLEPGESSVLLTDDGLFHVLGLVDRVATGTTPRVEWVVDVLRNRLLVDKRKQMYSDQVQRLRNRALAEGRLEVRE